MTDIIIHNNRRYRRVVRDQQTYRLGVTLGLVTIRGQKYVCRLEEDAQSDPAPNLTCEVHDPATDQWTPASLAEKRHAWKCFGGSVKQHWIVIAPAGGRQS